MEAEASHGVGEGETVLGAFRRNLEYGKALSAEATMGMHEWIVVPNVLYGCEQWTLHTRSSV